MHKADKPLLIIGPHKTMLYGNIAGAISANHFGDKEWIKLGATIFLPA